MDDTILTALAATLVNAYGLKAYTDEQKQGFSEPCFFIDRVQSSTSLLKTYLHRALYSFDVIYFAKSKRAAFQMGDELSELMEVITLADGNKIRGADISYNYVDGALHFFVTYALNLKTPVDKAPYMQTIKAEGNVTNG